MNIQRLKVLFSSHIVKNGIWLYILQLFNTVMPLITLPYITRILGPSQYGVFSSALNLVGYFQVIVEYGFNLSGARKIAIAKDSNEISEIYSKITASKLFLCGVTFFIMIIISLFLGINKTQLTCMIILYSMVLGTAIQQTWLFHGLQDMKYITIISMISRAISVVMILILIKDAEQLYLYCSLYSLTFLLIGIISILIIKLKFKICFKRVKARELLNELKDGWYLFTTSAMSKIFSDIGLTVLVFTSTDRNVGIYSAIYKIPLIITMIYAPIGQIIYPYVSKKYTYSFENGIRLIKRILKFIIPILSVLSLIMICCSKIIINFIYGSEYSAHSLLLAPLIFWMGLSILNNLLGIQILVASGHLKEYSVSFRIGVIAILLFNITFGVIGGMYGVAIAAMLAELTLTIVIIFYIKRIKRGIKI